MNSRRRRAPEGGLSCGAAQQHRTSAIERGAGGAPLRVAPGRRVFVSLGSNQGDRVAFLRAAGEALAALPATSLVASSGIYETAPQDRPDQDVFLNQVVCIET
ncbi:MAG: 2-amino-4-hydroxy-6-hydroxymethyldihydropteridine diphosphokinase, partial [Thermoleophilia bacterium]|nr:2-amino-4-hydroxy-6-hydroxymethyldihydropteridine diphosphokinase [Thermoleophilia bacterium]